jgi:hypothetical protein
VSSLSDKIDTLVDVLDGFFPEHRHVLGVVLTSVTCGPADRDGLIKVRPRSEYGAIVVLAELFWLQSMKTLPARRLFAIVAITRFGVSAASRSASVFAYADGLVVFAARRPA